MALDVVEETGQPAGTVAGFTAHGSAEPRGQSAVPLSVLFEGRFGRMFRDPSIRIVEHTDNAQIIDIFTFATYGGIALEPATYGQLTNFNFDCVTVGYKSPAEIDEAIENLNLALA